ncbi:NADH dehydrogenase [ubiquinone] iron-sulfur protein 6, mitochondrial-like [Rhopilema esculentum]|uniref:NADH dehydrogenase [ubiquinone] iron-sulfur protein 6, mitochondrial-like n=1 Tax=Rhopilema esculentum TaxID=499914 RepID=UPI0031E05726|eukprot:gene1438-15864_t
MAGVLRIARCVDRHLLPAIKEVNRAISTSVVCLDHHLLYKDKVTHTGQVFEDNDFQRTRFVDKQKEVNENFSQTLINEVPPIEVNQRVVSCDGGGGALGHPKVYINLDQDGPHACGYCGLRFEKKHH